MTALEDDELQLEVVQNTCLCGCGGTPKGKNARYLPGHDARHHSALKRAAAEAAAEAAPVTPVPVNEPTRPRRASRRTKVQGDTSRVAGSKA